MAPVNEFINKTHQRNLGFIHHSLLNDQNASRFRQSRCGNGTNCKSTSLHHYLFYHSLETDDQIDPTTFTDDEKESFIAFYETTKQEAFEIAKNGFPYGDHDSQGHKDYLHMKQNIFFTHFCSKSSPPSEAIMCLT